MFNDKCSRSPAACGKRRAAIICHFDRSPSGPSGVPARRDRRGFVIGPLSLVLCVSLLFLDCGGAGAPLPFIRDRDGDGSPGRTGVDAARTGPSTRPSRPGSAGNRRRGRRRKNSLVYPDKASGVPKMKNTVDVSRCDGYRKPCARNRPRAAEAAGENSTVPPDKSVPGTRLLLKRSATMRLPLCELTAFMCIPFLFAATSCSKERKNPLRFDVTAYNEDIRVELRIQALAPEAQEGVWCSLHVYNRSDSQLVVFDDPGLPTVLHVPPDTASVAYALAEQPQYALFEVPERFHWKALPPGGDHQYRFRVVTPLVENAHYGNPAYDDPESSYYQNRPAVSNWCKLAVQVGYLLLDKEGVADLSAHEKVSRGLHVQVGKNSRPVKSLQRQIGLTLNGVLFQSLEGDLE